MGFATPLAIAWAALTIPIVIFYVLKIRLRQMPVSTTVFWQQIYDEKRPRSLWQQLRHWLSLLVQLAWLILLVLALAEPFFSWELQGERRIVVVVDNSASMNATDVAPSRLDAGQRAARDLVHRLRFRDQMAILTAGVHPQVVCGLTGHERTLLAAVDSITPTDGPTCVAEAIEIGKRLIAEFPRSEIIVISDGAFDDSEAFASDSKIRVLPIGGNAANVGLTNFQVRRGLHDPIGYEFLVEVTNASDEPVECRLDVDLNDQPVDVIPLKLAPGEAWRRTLEKTSVDGGRLVARLNQTDALAADNTAFAILPKRQIQNVVLVTEGNLFLQKAIEANPLVQLKVLAAPPEQYEANTIYVFHRAAPEELPEGSAMVIDPANSTALWDLSTPLENPVVGKQDNESPLMRHVRLDNALLSRARKLVPKLDATNLASAASGDPLYLSMQTPQSKVLVLTVDLDQGDLAFRTAFPIMISNALAWFADQSAELRESFATGAVAEVELSGSSAGASRQTESFVLRAPSEAERPLPASTGKTLVGPLDEVGVWRIHTQTASDERKTGDDEADAVVVELAANLSNPRESDLHMPASWSAIETTDVVRGGWFARPIWFYLISGAWLVAVVEWIAYQRRWIS